MCCFQTFQLTALVVKSPAELHPVFAVSLNGVAISHEKVKEQLHVCRILCVILYSRKETFLNTAVTAADAV